ncbi:NEDD8-activating enzyme E1 regulatory subunit [Paramyrothecium foliicola]|nr:NEDD8-activating enzyme E1 regulatory subunit [Paramyrothecium foliicola]
MADTPPVLHGPSEKERKYDRQLRLWAATGQSALESANILLVNSGAGTVCQPGLGSQQPPPVLVTNPTLPGIGRFTIADDVIVGDADLGVNFFLDESSRGKSRAECCTELLLELNPDVQGDWFPKAQMPIGLEEILSNSPLFTIIIYTLPIEPQRLQLIENYARQHATPAIAVHSVGFYSYFKVDLPSVFPIVDTHPDETATTDLRLLDPWPELMEFALGLTKDMESLNAHDHGHIPMLAILLHYLDQWKQTHEGSYPVKYQDKIAFRDLVSSGMRRDNPEGGEENFEEAVAAVMKHVVAPSLPSSLRQVFEYQHDDRDRIKSGFWLIADAVKQFYDRNNRLPVPGGLPDMKAQSSVYIKLQNIYKEKARQDANEILTTVRSIPGGEEIDAAEVELFAANARFIKLINPANAPSTTLEQTAEREFGNDEFAATAGPEMPMSLIPIYLALTATSHASTSSSQDIMTSIRNRAPVAANNGRVEQAAQEVARAAGGELHNISAVMGGMVAQEVIKIITQQYIPVDNTCIFDGIESRCQVLRL